MVGAGDRREQGTAAPPTGDGLINGIDDVSDDQVGDVPASAADVDPRPPAAVLGPETIQIAREIGPIVPDSRFEQFLGLTFENMVI